LADSKSTRSRKRKKAVRKAVRKAVPARQFLRFPELKGKILNTIEIDPDGEAILLLFQDNTALSFDLNPRLSIFPELSERRAGDWYTLKRWDPVHTPSSIERWR
jgi:hypothetical protein